MVPLTDAFAQVFRGKTPLAIRRHRRKRLHRGGAGREHIAVGREPVGFLPRLPLLTGRVPGGVGELHFIVSSTSGQAA